MQTLIYIHGFLSSSQSHKAQLTRAWLCKYHPDINYLCPELSPYPDDTQAQLEAVVEPLLASAKAVDIGLVGSSLGGFWATWLVERYGLTAVLINPSVRPFELVERIAGEPQKSFYSDNIYTMTARHAEQLRAVYPESLSEPGRYWLLAQTGDETLDYRQAVARYQGCRQCIEAGGDHGFRGYESHLPAILNFLFPGIVLRRS